MTAGIFEGLYFYLTFSLANLGTLKVIHKHSFYLGCGKITNVVPINQATQPSTIRLRKEMNRVIFI